MNKKPILPSTIIASLLLLASSAWAEEPAIAAEPAPAVASDAAPSAPPSVEAPAVETPASSASTAPAAVAPEAPSTPQPAPSSPSASAPSASVPSGATPAKGGLGLAKGKPAKKRHHYLGVLLDIGVPDLVGVSVVGRPLRWMRLALGATTDGASAGIRGGVTLVPFNFPISPSLTIEGGHVFDGNVNALTNKFGVSSPALQRVGYDYGNAHLGVELGSPNRALFFIHAGYSYLTAQIHNFQSAVGGGSGSKSGSPTFGDPTISVIGPSAKLGLVVYFL